MPSRRAVIVSSCEPCASATSNLRSRAQLRNARSRDCICRALPSAERPPWCPITVAVIPWLSISCKVCAYSRAVISTSSPCARSRSTSGRKTSGCALAVMSIQTRTTPNVPVEGGPLRDDVLEGGVARDALDVPLVPERQREQPPQLTRQVVPSAHVVVDHTGDG